MACSVHLIFKFVLLLLEFDLIDFLLVEEFVALDAQQVELFDLVLQHEFKFLDMGFVEFIALESLLLEEFDLQL
jgi:hypothetical protein